MFIQTEITLHSKKSAILSKYFDFLPSSQKIYQC